MKVNILLYVKLSNSFKKEEKGYETKKTGIMFSESGYAPFWADR